MPISKLKSIHLQPKLTSKHQLNHLFTTRKIRTKITYCPQYNANPKNSSKVGEIKCDKNGCSRAN